MMDESADSMRDLSGEMTFQASRSSGAGGQNVNKVNTRIELRFNIDASPSFTAEEKETLRAKLKNRINKEGDLIIVSQTERTQAGNRIEAEKRFYAMISSALKPVRKRTPTRPTAASKEKRLSEKKAAAEKKTRRKNIEPE